MAFEELRDVLRHLLLDVFLDVRLEKTAEEGADQVAEAFREAFVERVQPWNVYLQQIADLTPEKEKILIGTGEAWVLGDPCDCVHEHTSLPDPHSQYISRPEAMERFAPLEHGHAEYDHAGAADDVMRAHLTAPDPHEGRYEPKGTAAVERSAHEGSLNPHPQYTTITSATAIANGRINAHVAHENPHGQYQLASQKGQANGYASLDPEGRVPASQLPVPVTAYASSFTSSSAPAMGNPFAGLAVVQAVPPEGVSYDEVAGVWLIDAGGVYEVTAVLVLTAGDTVEVDVQLASAKDMRVLSGLTVDTQRRTVVATAMLVLEAADKLSLQVTPGGVITPTMEPGSVVTIRRVA